MSIHLASIIEAMADTYGHAPAIITSTGDQHTYQTLDDTSTRLANHLLSLGYRPGDRIAIHGPNSIQWIEAMLACCKVNILPININYRMSDDDIIHVYNTSRASGAFVDPAHHQKLSAITSQIPTLRYILPFGYQYERAIADASTSRTAFPPRSNNDSYVAYSSSTTGTPVGILWEQSTVIHAAMNAARFNQPIHTAYHLASEALTKGYQARILCISPLANSGAQWILGSSIVSGSTLLLYTHPTFDPHEILTFAADQKSNSLPVMGDSMAAPLANHLLAHPNTYDLTSIFRIANGAAPLTPPVRAKLAQALPNVEILDVYGASEAGIIASRSNPNLDSPAQFDLAQTVTVVDDSGRHCPVGQPGRIAKRGLLPVGFLGAPELDAERFVWVDGERWVLPGDWGYIDGDGSVVMLGRGSACVNTGGEKVFVEPVEAVLKGCEGVVDVAVFGVPDERWGERLVGLVILSGGVSVDDVLAFGRERLGGVRCPKELRAVDTVPRNLAGKVLIGRCRAVWGELAP